jgi:hypothetical protein
MFFAFGMRWATYELANEQSNENGFRENASPEYLALDFSDELQKTKLNE